MKKEKVLAALLGATVGFVLAVVLLLQRSQSFSQKEEVSLEKKSNPSPTVSPITGIQFISPANKRIVKEDKIKLSFKVPKDSLVVVVSPAIEKAVFAKEEKVEVEVKLALGENKIKIYSYPTNPALVNLEKEVVVYYLEKKI